ncbi:hypothetical protein CERZMDRAFT_49885 [Cercospora zeae-maydis SCOH1-5]|uniref:Uncharacterized protein n=1 Tax=Cercospora zeae-maydis SCOH1-5 TaxID=717836 RepID=A0A6A6F6Z1_9PEZI|nr:hypothetical protein CERZMDRAFT_49885 [Cercospora zeae-maydis SCOH1-5]
MLRARRLSLRIAFRPWTAEVAPLRRSFARRGELPPSQPNAGNARSRNGHQNIDNPHAKPVPSIDTHAAPAPKPSLIEQLFPEETKRYEKQQQAAAREVPKLPLDALPPVPKRPRKIQEENENVDESSKLRRLRSAIEHAPPGAAVLVLRNASKNLTTEDFRRLIPQGRHIEGWTLQESDILQVIPGRDLQTLEQLPTYYIIFSSEVGAFTYQQHVVRIHKLASIHTPTSNTSPIPPPPGYMIEGLDAHAAIEAYALKPPSQQLELHQLRRPFSPMIDSILAYGGYRAIVQRQGKMPFEVRLTMDGPQLHTSRLRHIFLETAKERNLSWSGGQNMELSITRWEPQVSPKSADTSEYAAKNVPRPGDEEEEEQQQEQAAGNEQGKKRSRKAKLQDILKQLPKRTPPHVFIVGFHTHDAAQSFVMHWHMRKLKEPDPRASYVEEDAPPVAHVELLW